MELWILDKNFNKIGILEKFDTLRWTRRYYKNGMFQLYCTLTNESLNLLKSGNLIYKKDDDELAYIEYRKITLDITGKEILVICGKFITAFFNRRIIWDTESIDTTVEKAMRYIVESNCINPKIKERIIPKLELGKFHGFNEKIKYQISYKNILDELEKLSNLSNLGYKLTFNPKLNKMFFIVYRGLDRTSGQNENSKCIFCKEFENILQQEYIDSIDNYKNVTLVAGSGQGNNRKLITIGNASNLDRFEVFTDARDLQNTKYINDKEVIITDEKYLPQLIERGNIKLSSYKKIASFNSKLNLNSNLKYKQDFNLGDIVTCTSKKWGITLDRRITEIEEIYDKNGVEVNITFGNEAPTLIDKIKQNLE